MGLIPFIIVLLTGLNLFNTISLSSLNNLSDSSAKLLHVNDFVMDTIPELEDVPLDIANQCLVHESFEDS